MRRQGRSEFIRERLANRSIVFVGMMGSGKSAIGRLVASRLRMTFFDSDHEIVAAAGMEIPEIFEQFGEAYFRSGEQRVIARLLKEGPAIVSLGGGAFCNEETREMVADAAISVWLKADLDLLMNRVMRRPGTRPLLQTENPRETLRELMETRTPIYALADIAVESSRHSRKQTSDDVIRSLHEWLRTRDRLEKGV